MELPHQPLSWASSPPFPTVMSLPLHVLFVCFPLKILPHSLAGLVSMSFCLSKFSFPFFPDATLNKSRCIEVEVLAMWTERMSFPSLEHFRHYSLASPWYGANAGSALQAAATKAPCWLSLAVYAYVRVWIYVSMDANLGRLSKPKAEWSWVTRILGLQTSETGDFSGVRRQSAPRLDASLAPCPISLGPQHQFRVLRRGFATCSVAGSRPSV